MSNPYFVCREKCPSCSSDSFRTIYTNPYHEAPLKDYLEGYYSYLRSNKEEFSYITNANYTLLECKNCDLIFQYEIPNNDLMKRVYGVWLKNQATITRVKNLDLDYYADYAEEIMKIIAFFNKPPSSLSIFDFGMGWGKWALMAKAFGCNSYGLEFSSIQVEHARSNGISIIKREEMDKQQFDFINTEQVFEHIPDPLDTFLQLKAALKTNGIIKVSVPTANNINRRLRVMDWKAVKSSKNSLKPVAPLEHINYFKRTSLNKMAHVAGFEEVYIPLKIQYKFVTNWNNLKKIKRNIFMPVYLNILKRQNYLFFRKID